MLTVPRRLVDVLRSLPPSELNALIGRLGIRIDPHKRLDTQTQAARSLVALPEVRDTNLLPPASAELLHRIAEARGVMMLSALPHAVEPLAARGIVFVRIPNDSSVELVLPVAYLVQLRSWEGEDPRGARALLAQAVFETCSAIASHYLGRPATPPIAIALEAAWEVLVDPARVLQEVERLAPSERRLLEAIEREGGEVDTEELLDLEREPMRLRTAMGATPSRRGAGFALERRGFLIPIHPNRHVIPTEVAAVIGAANSAEREARRERLRVSLQSLGREYHPYRARFAEDPAPLALALAIAMRETSNDVRSGVGTPRSLILKLGQRFGRDMERITLLAALSRAVGLWDTSALSSASPPGSWSVQDLGGALFELWRRGGAWDEARREGEMYRVASEARDASPIGTLREMVLDGLRDLGEGRWVPWQVLAEYVQDDARTGGVARLLRRWSERAGVPPMEPLEVVQRMVFETLPALGIVDVGDTSNDKATGPVSNAFRGYESRTETGGMSWWPPSSTRRKKYQDEVPPTLSSRTISSAEPSEVRELKSAHTQASVSEEAEAPEGPAVRLTSRGRAWLSGVRSPVEPMPSQFVGKEVLRIGTSALVASVLALATFVEIGEVSDSVHVIVSLQSVARVISAGIESDVVRDRIAALAPVPEVIGQLLAQASVVVARVTYTPAMGFLWVDDSNVRALLASRRQTAELFLDPSPPAGLLLAPGVDLERVIRRCRALGVEILQEGNVLRARTPAPPAVGLSTGASAASPPSERRTRNASNLKRGGG